MTIPPPRIAFIAVLFATSAACADPSVVPLDDDGGSADAGVGSASDAPPDGFAPDVIAIAVDAPDGQPARKGRPIRLTITVENRGAVAGTTRLVPRLSSGRWSDFAGVPLPASTVTLAPGERRGVVLTAGPFLTSGDRRWAIGRGAFTIESVGLEHGGGPLSDRDFTGGAFEVAASNVVFTAVVYDPAYFARIGYQGDVVAYLEQAYTRPAEVFTPDEPGTYSGRYEAFPGGFDQMMGIEQQFDVVSGLAADSHSGGFCEQVGAYARRAFGLARNWDADESAGQFTDPDHHGYDVLVGLTPAMGGGAACGWLGVQVSSLFDQDLSLDRSQIVLVHETGHLFGAPHCDPLQGFVMCAGEQHEHYRTKGTFVWHATSRAAMSNHWR